MFVLVLAIVPRGSSPCPKPNRPLFPRSSRAQEQAKWGGVLGRVPRATSDDYEDEHEHEEQKQEQEAMVFDFFPVRSDRPSSIVLKS